LLFVNGWFGRTYEPPRRPTIKNILKRLQETAKEYKEPEPELSSDAPMPDDEV
jgi:hypothetical protein